MHDKAVISAQVERFKKGFPWLKIVSAATPQRGIEVLSDEQVDEAISYVATAEVKGKCKFVPASGAASRMFKDIFAGLETPNAAVEKLAENIQKFAFYTPEMFDGQNAAAKLLGSDGLGYGSKPKGVLKFHRYADGECRTAFAEHLVEGQEYMRNDDGSVHLVVTISPEHRSLFEAALDEVKAAYEKKYNVSFDIKFTYQDPATDTVAVDTENKPFLKEDGSILFRPAGHGALIHNLNDVEEELVVIKNIDNVANERFLPVTARYKKALMGRALQLRDTIFAFLTELDIVTGQGLQYEPYGYLPGYNALPEDMYATDQCQELCNRIEQFLYEELCIKMPETQDCKARVLALIKKLNRPIRVCGMVRNEGEPGGGPFIIEAKDGSTSLQILESAQVNKEDAHAADAMARATHFNPVDLVCCLRDYHGEKFNLLEHVDEETGFISSKSYQGRELKALELPGLWNGSMSDWNTLFVEVPAETFNPVKQVLDLLRPAHQ